MRSFILMLWAIVLIKPCFSQTMDNNFVLKTSIDLSYSSINDDFSYFPKDWTKSSQIKVIFIPQEQAHLIEAQDDSENFWGANKADFDTFPIQMKLIPVNKKKTQFLLQSINEAQMALGLDVAYFDLMPFIIVGDNFQEKDDSSFWIEISKDQDKNNMPNMISNQKFKNMYINPGNGGGGVFYQLDKYFQSDITFVAGPGNGGGGTYIR